MSNLRKDLKISALFVLAFLLGMMVWSGPILTFIGILSIGHFYSQMHPELFYPIAAIVWIAASYQAYKLFKEEK